MFFAGEMPRLRGLVRHDFAWLTDLTSSSLRVEKSTGKQVAIKVIYLEDV